MYIPDFLLKLGLKSKHNQKWLDELPSLVERAKKKWNLTLGPPYTENASCSYVVPCRTDEGGQAVLKIGLPHEEALHEIRGLKVLNGCPTVQLLDADESANTMLLEQCIPGSQLSEKTEFLQDAVISKLLPEIWNIPNVSTHFRPLAEMIAYHNEETLSELESFSDPKLAIEGCKLKEKLVSTTIEHVLLATDLHAGNVLQAERKPWLVIDIKPYYGDKVYDLTQHLLNCKERLKANPKETINRLASLAGVDKSRLQAWIYARLCTKKKRENQALARQIKQSER